MSSLELSLKEKMEDTYKDPSWREVLQERFTQYWPDENGDFSPLLFFGECLEVLQRGEDPIVPAGATEKNLSVLMLIRIQQRRLSGAEPELLEILGQIEKVIKPD